MDKRVLLLKHILCLTVLVKKFKAETVDITLDDVIDRRIKQFKELCPYTSMCYTNATEDPGRLSWGNFASCCGSCTCSDDCDLNCCPDGFGRFETEEALYNASKIYRCVDSQYRKRDRKSESLKRNGLSYWMVSECPYKYNDTDIQKKCRREYGENNFDVQLRYIVPVYDGVTASTYKNIYCAQCHNVDLKNLEFASLTFECLDKGQALNYISDLTGIEDRCNILFTTYKGSTCSPAFIDRCNVTGQWDIYDPEIEESCLSYTSVYKTFFKNVHCSLCNGFNETDIESVCATRINTSNQERFFTMIIDFSGSRPISTTIIENDEYEDNSCMPNDIYNTEKRSKWNLQCPGGMMIGQNMMCLPEETVRITRVFIEISLSPDTHSHETDSLQNFLANLTKEIEGKRDLLVTRDVLVRRIQGTIQFSDRFPLELETKSKINLQMVQAIDLRIDLMVDTRRRVFETLLDFTLVFTKLLKYGNFIARYKQFNSEFYHMQKYQHRCWRVRNLPLFLLCMQMSEQLGNKLNFHISNERAKLMTSRLKIDIEPEPFCPRVAIPKLPYADDQKNCNESLHLSIILTDSFLSKALSENTTHVFLCHEDYFQHINNLPTTIDDVQDEELPARDIYLVSIMYLAVSCLTLSLLSLSLTLIIYSVFPDLRTLPGLNNMALVISLIVFQTMSLVSTVAGIEATSLCSLFGVVTHYSFVNSFSWMFICTFHMMKVFIKIRNRTVPRNDSLTFIFYTIFTTTVSAVAVVVTIVIAEIQSSGNDMGYGGYGCYIKNPVMIMCAAAIPAATVVVLNLGMFCLTVFKISKHDTGMGISGARKRSNIAIFAKLSTITGLTWAFGFVYVFTKLTAFEYLFIILNAGQGVFIMFSFIINRRVLGLIRSKFLYRK